MSVPKASALIVTLATLSLLLACGGSNSATPPPSGSFTGSTLSGTYVFSFSGTDITSSVTNPAFAVAGVLVASNGNFTSGSTIDINDPSLTAAVEVPSVQTGLPATGTYSVTADGRGTGTITVSINGNNVPLGIDFVLSSSSTGLITRFDGFGTGSGTIDLQTAGVTQASLAGSYAFGLGGADLNGNSLGSVGTFTLDASGNVTAGLEDFNDASSSNGLTALTLVVPSAVTVGAPSGTAQLNATAGGLSSLGFDVWVIDSTHVKLIETDSTGNVLAGDAFVSTQTSFPSGQLVFTMAGGDDEGNPLAIGGYFTSDGSSIISTGLEDVNDGGSVGGAPLITGGFTPFTGGRTALTLSGLFNGGFPGNSPATAGTYTFAAYPYNGGVELLEIDGEGGITAGAAYPQTPSTLAASQGYALNLSGANTTGDGWSETDMIAQFTTNGSNSTSSGLYDANNLGVLVKDQQLSNSNSSPPAYANDSNGDGRGMMQFPDLQAPSSSAVIGALDFTFYTVDSSTIVFIETDSNQVATGTLLLQSPSATSPAARPHMATMRPIVRPHALKKRN